MPRPLPIPFNPAILAWARQESGLAPDRIAQNLCLEPKNHRWRSSVVRRTNTTSGSCSFRLLRWRIFDTAVYVAADTPPVAISQSFAVTHFMLTDSDLRILLADLESDRVERTRSTTDTDKFCTAICAFSNDMPNHRAPGYLLIGVEDNGDLSGLSVTDTLLKDVAAIRSNGNILPLPAMTVTAHSLQGGDVVVVEVVPSDLPPVRYKGRVWIRVGPRRSIASETEERMLNSRRAASARSFDAHPVAGAALSDLSLALFNAYRQDVVASDVIAANNRTEKEQLASLRFFDLDSDTPTAAGIILFGTNPRFFLPGHYVQYLRFPGDAMTDPPDDQAEISGDLLGLLRELDQRIRVDIQTRMRSTSTLRERIVPDYPEVAVRELMMNAIMHRDYQSTTPVRFYWFSDRIEIQNPGGLYGEVTPETLRQRNSYRNPVIAEAMKSLGYVNRFGYGIQRADAELLANGNPPVEFTIDERVFAVTIRGVER